MEATTKDLRLRARELLAAADRGEEVIITWRGKKRARLMRWATEPEATSTTAGRNPAFGLWADLGGDVDTQVRALRQRRTLP